MTTMMLDLGFGTLVVEGSDFDGVKDLWVSLEDNNGKWIQDLVHVGSSYKIGPDIGVVDSKNDEVKVHVWADENDKDWTKEFIIKKYEEVE